jgi:NAD(P)-dependent dehydrogenase (short-subunit alcohol dehydrogenase family)
MNPLDLTGRVALVTGGNSGIGLGMARGLSEARAHVTIWGTNADKNSAAVESGAAADAAVVDVADEAAVAAAMAALAERHGRLDACFANAGRSLPRTPLLETNLDDFHHVTQLNLDGAFVTLREAARAMVAAGNGGSLVATSSLAALMGQAGGYAYAASKGGLVAIVKALAVELARHGIRANALLPGWIESDMTGPALANPRFVENVMPRMPMRRWGTGADFAAIAVYLASDGSRFHTGDSILIDGGYAAF